MTQNIAQMSPIASEVSESGCTRLVQNTSIYLSTGSTESGLSFTLDMDQNEPIEHSNSLHEDIEKLFEKAPEITLSDLLSTSSECIPSDRGIEVTDIPIAIADSRVLEGYDMTSHRHSSFPHVHVLLKSLQSHSSKNVADEEEAEKKREKKKKKQCSKMPKKAKSVIFPSKSALLSPAICEAEKEEYSQSEDDDQDAEDDDDDDGNADETTQFLDNVDDESATLVITDRKELAQTVLLLDTTDKKQIDLRHTDQDFADTWGHIRIPYILGGELDGNKSDATFHPGHFYIGSQTSNSTHYEFESKASSFQHTPELPAADDTGKPVVCSLTTEAGGKFTALHHINASPVINDDTTVKFLLGSRSWNSWEELQDVHNYEYKHVSKDSSDEENDEQENDNKADNSNDSKEDDNIAADSKDEDDETMPTFLTPTGGLENTKKKHKSTSSMRSKSRRHYHHENYCTEDLLKRRQRGSEVQMLGALRRVPTETDEAVTLQSVDLDEMASHRMENLQGLRMHKIGRKKHQASSRMGKASKISKKLFKPKKTYEHTPHEVFVELDELYTYEGCEVEWREKARWIKFEEDVEEGAERWGKPHVASLSFHSLLELRKLLEAGSLLFDLEVTDFVELVHKICDNMVIHDQIPSDCKGRVVRTLLTKRKHQNHQHSLMKTLSSTSFNIPSAANIPALLCTYGNCSNNQSCNKSQGLMSVFHDMSNLGSLHDNMISMSSQKDNTVANKEQEKINKKVDPGTVEFVKVDVDKNMATDDGIHIGLIPKEGDVKEMRTDQSLMRRIHLDAEACTVLVGCVDYLSKPAMAFVRLAEKQVFDNLTEVPLPVRFLFVLLGPSGGMDFHEVGRSISTLMSNQHFHEIAYKAEAQSEILHAINEFLNESIVLPPGDWDQKTLLPVMDMARKRAKVRRKKKKKEKEAQMKKDILVDPLKRTGRPFGGLINDIRCRYPHYASDFKDALSLQCIMALIFIFFACLCPCIAFGGLYAEKTHNKIGVVETILGTAITNLVFGLFSGQPLILYGATGPVLVFEKHLYSFCKESHIDFLTWRVWIGFWVFIITLVVLAFEGSFIVRYITRFMEEVFAILISLIFINEVIQKLVDIYKEHPLRDRQFYCDITNNNGSNNSNRNGSDIMNVSGIHTSRTMLSIPDISLKVNKSSNISTITRNGNGYSISGLYAGDKLMDHEHALYSDIMQPNTALLSTILVLGTFLIAYFLRIFRNSRFLGRSARRALGDFGIFTAIICMVVFDFLCADTYTQKLEIPNAFGHTDSSLGQWLVNPLGDKEQMPSWLIFMAVIPAFLLFLLLFLECQLTEMLLHKKEFKLRKGSGFHLDQFILGIITFLCSLFGLPWMCPATVRSVAHVSALSVMSRTHAPGEKPKLVEVKDQRVTNIIMNILIGTTLFWGNVLRAVPMAVLFGVFLYLGVSAISGIQFYKRIKLLFIPVKHHPSVSYVRRVKTSKMHIFTIIQLVMVMILWVVKSTIVAIAFPLFVFLMVPFRLKLMPKLFTPDELNLLDKEEEDSDDEEVYDPDFYQMAHMPV